MRHREKRHVAPGKTLRILFLTKIQCLTKYFGLMGNDLETSKVLIFTIFCIKLKERLFDCKGMNLY